MKIQQDKLLHFIAGMVICTFFTIFVSIYVGIMFATLAGLVKDVVYDLWLGKGCFDVYDIVWTIAGCIPVIIVYLFI